MVATGRSHTDSLLDEYEREQRVGSEMVQNANAQVFWNIAVADPRVAAGRASLLKFISHLSSVTQAMVASETLINQKIRFPETLEHVSLDF